MFNNWWKDFDPLNYETFKKNVKEINEKVFKFWRDWSNDVFSTIKRDD